MKRIGSVLTALVLLQCALVTALPASARADGSELNYVEFSYNGRSYLLTVGSQARFSDVYTSLGLSGTLRGIKAYSDPRVGGMPPLQRMDGLRPARRR
ncbi:MAG: hypothetical protein IKQ41_07255 [Clostridia bacterium]|nr:hypothetical protein [Clostridia bacterium]